MNKQVIFSLLLFFFSVTTILAEQEPCYVVIESPGSYENLVVTSITLTMIRQFVEPSIQPFPTGGISEKECMYRVNVTEK